MLYSMSYIVMRREYSVSQIWTHCSGERLFININAVRWDGRTKHCMLEFSLN